jgi:hypothetical protein
LLPNRIMKKLCSLALLFCLTSCVGTRTTGDNFTVHAETFNLLGFQIPGDDQEAAWELVPEGATITSVQSSPSDWTSFFGVLSRIIGVSATQISGKQ